MEVAVGILTIQAIVINRLAGLDYPVWARRAEAREDEGRKASEQPRP